MTENITQRLPGVPLAVRIQLPKTRLGSVWIWTKATEICSIKGSARGGGGRPDRFIIECRAQYGSDRGSFTVLCPPPHPPLRLVFSSWLSIDSARFHLFATMSVSIINNPIRLSSIELNLPYRQSDRDRDNNGNGRGDTRTDAQQLKPESINANILRLFPAIFEALSPKELRR